MVYEFDVTSSTSVTNGTTISNSTVYPTYTDNTLYPYTTWTWTGYNDRYFYQIRCPKCKKMNFCELNKEVTCKCKAVLRAVEKKIDYEVEIEK